MEHKKEIVSKLVRILLTNQGKWRDIKIDDSSPKVTFIDLVLANNKLNIEINELGQIIFSFDDGWSYFTGNPMDKVFKNHILAIKYLKKILSEKRRKKFNIKYKGKEHEGFIELTNIDPHRNMGVEKLYQISFMDNDGEEIVVAEFSEYPAGAFTFFDTKPSVQFSQKEVIDFIRQEE